MFLVPHGFFQHNITVPIEHILEDNVCISPEFWQKDGVLGGSTENVHLPISICV